MTRIARTVLVTGLGLSTALLAGCGEDQSRNAAITPMSATSPEVARTGASADGQVTGASSGSSGSAGTGDQAGAGLPTVPYDYGNLLLAAWARGDRTQAARYATPEAVQQLFAHRPVAGLVNFECTSEGTLTCGWIGKDDARVMLDYDKARLAKRANQAIVAARVTAA